ncbi:MAG: Kazal-type serine protease inhibitor family protein [Deltaproteobacteria bacterium]|nr:Kazal-type serine protease inhibitor family protein [Deltaproteobacteria bacterium]
MKRIAFLTALLALGCSTDATETMNKDEARQGVAKGDFLFDVCEFAGWYGDGICDDFCQYPDVEDCGPEPVTCLSNNDCGTGERCNAGEICLSNCPPDVICAQVCAGFCVEDDGGTEPDQCWGSWTDPATGACRGPADGIMPDECCFDDAQICGGFSNTPCDDDEWCDFTPAPEGAASSMTGICKPRPSACYEIYAPVCGLDGETYANDCFAHAAGVDVEHDGPCQ